MFHLKDKNLFSYKKNESKYEFYFNNKRSPVFNKSDINYVADLERESRHEYKYLLFETTKPSTPINLCFDYSKDKQFKSKTDCQRQCKLIEEKDCCFKRQDCGIKWSLEKKSNCSLDYVNRRISGSISFGRPYYENIEEPRMFPGIEDCSDCPQDCTSFMHSVSHINSKHTFTITSQLQIQDTEPVVKIEFSLKLSMIEYVIYIASCISLWFGFSMFQTLLDLTKKFNKSLNEKNSNSNPMFIKTNRIQNINSTPITHHTITLT